MDATSNRVLTRMREYLLKLRNFVTHSVASVGALALLWWYSRRAPSRSVLDVHIVDVSGADENGQLVLDRISVALEQINRFDARRLRRLRRDVERIIIWRQPTPASFVQCGRMITLDVDFVLDYQVEARSAVLVHEATHARLSTHGIHQSGRHFAAVERRCYLEQLAYLERVPDAEAWRDWTRQVLADKIYGESKAIENTGMRPHRIRFLKGLGLPGWLERLLLRLVPK